MIDENIEAFRQIAHAAAQAAGEILRDNWRLPKTIDYKGVIDLVTSVDRDCERKIIEVIRRGFPDHSILAEEETDIQNAQCAYRWIIDPLDGTTNFAHGYPQFCVSIALEQRSQVIFGLVYDPVRDERFEAALGQGATLNGEALCVSAVSELDKALLSTGFPYDRRNFADVYLSYFKEFMIRCQGIRRAGSAALDLLLRCLRPYRRILGVEAQTMGHRRRCLDRCRSRRQAERFFREALFYRRSRNTRIKSLNPRRNGPHRDCDNRKPTLTASLPDDRNFSHAPVVKRISRGSPEP